MGRFVEGADRSQLTLLPECLEDWAPKRIGHRTPYDYYARVINVGNDRGQLARMSKQAKEVLGVDKLEAVADRGYLDGEEILLRRGWLSIGVRLGPPLGIQMGL